MIRDHQGLEHISILEMPQEVILAHDRTFYFDMHPSVNSHHQISLFSPHMQYAAI